MDMGGTGDACARALSSKAAANTASIAIPADASSSSYSSGSV